MQIKHQKNAYPTKKNQVLNGVFSGALDLENLKKYIFGHFFSTMHFFQKLHFFKFLSM